MRQFAVFAAQFADFVVTLQRAAKSGGGLGNSGFSLTERKKFI